MHLNVFNPKIITPLSANKVYDEVVKTRKSLRIVIPVPIFIGINSSRNQGNLVIPAKAGIQSL
jgi:hypothetical protein